jgi:hypothetical protein
MSPYLRAGPLLTQHPCCLILRENGFTPKGLLGRREILRYSIDDLRKEEMMKRRKMLAAVFLLSLFVLSCATTQHVSTKVIPDTARIVRLYVPSCT